MTEPTGTVIYDPATDELRMRGDWPIIDPRTGQRRTLRLRVARGRIVDESTEAKP